MKKTESDRPTALVEERETDVPDGIAAVLESQTSVAPPPTGGFAECVDDTHPTLLGRVRVRRDREERWVPTLMDLRVRKGDRVLLQPTGDRTDPLIAVGVVDGYAARPTPSPEPVQQLSLEKGQSLRIVSSRGRPLVDIVEGEDGATIRLLGDGVTLEAEDQLSLKAKRIDVQATEGPVRIEASEDVEVQGETIQLN